jgi:hypothetical protein
MIVVVILFSPHPEVVSVSSRWQGEKEEDRVIIGEGAQTRAFVRQYYYNRLVYYSC